jgi:chemotaxis response regulator CheB
MGENMAPPFSIILADDNVMFGRGVRRIIQGINDVEVVGEASDGFELLELLKKTSPHSEGLYRPAYLNLIGQ